MLDPALSRQRQGRLVAAMAALKVDAIICGWRPNIYYLSAHWAHWLQQAAIIIFADGRSWLCTANRPAQNVAADQVVAYEANWLGTQRQEQPATVAEHALEALHGRNIRAIGLDASEVAGQVALRWEGPRQAIDPVLWELRRRKDADELALIRKAIDCTRAMYERARQIIAPGVAELRVFNELHAAAVESAGEPLSALLGNDYASGVGGGPPRRGKVAEAGHVYILDLGPAYRGYFSDNARSFCVDRRPTEAQQRAAEAVSAALRIVEGMARPGVRCRDIFQAVDEHFRQACGKPLPHHLGHGIGLQPHEYPHLNPRWDDVLIEGEVFTAEPGMYGPELAGGVRIENDYLVTSGGVQSLLDFSESLTP